MEVRDSGMNRVCFVRPLDSAKEGGPLALLPKGETWEHYEYPWDVSLCSSHKKTIFVKLSAHGSHNCKRHAPLAHGHLQGTKTNQKLHTWFLRVPF